jgi:cell division protein FtsZ
MTGAASEAQQPQRAQPQVTPIYEEPATQADPEQERIEIPAFLRRQAN